MWALGNNRHSSVLSNLIQLEKSAERTALTVLETVRMEAGGSPVAFVTQVRFLTNV